MARLLIVEDSSMLCNIFDELLQKYTSFDYKIAKTYEEAKNLLQKNRYEFAVADMNLPDAKHGEIISLLNKHNVAPIVFTGILDEDFREGFESAQIVDYVLKERYENILYVVEKLKQLEANKQKTVLIIDDSFLYTSFLKQNFLLHHFKVLTASNGKEGLERLEHHPEVELVITDYHMPEMDGLEFVRRIRKSRSRKDLSIIVLTTDTNSYTTSRFLKDGADDYITKPFSRDEFYARVYQNIETIGLFGDMKKGFNEDIIHLLSNMAEYKGSKVNLHVRRIQEYSYTLARLSGMFEEEAELLGKLSVLHDIGNISVDDKILTKPSKLTKEEFEEVKKHTEVGANLIEDAFSNDEQVAKLAREIILYHHERWDGNGYPEGIPGNVIPIHARIVTMIDIFDALTNKQFYREAWPLEKVIEYFEENSSVIFDPKLTKLFLDNIDCFTNILNKYSESPTEVGPCKI